jgi:hypothetical protein
VVLATVSGPHSSSRLRDSMVSASKIEGIVKDLKLSWSSPKASENLFTAKDLRDKNASGVEILADSGRCHVTPISQLLFCMSRF